MNNQTIGIAGVFALTIFLFVLRHFVLSLGRPKQRRHVNPMIPRKDQERRTTSADDDDWLLWRPKLDRRAGVPKAGEHPDPNRFRLRS